MNRAMLLIAVSCMLLSSITMLASSADASALDERMIVGTWKGVEGDSVWYVTFNSDGTGKESDSGGTETFTWEIVDGQLKQTWDALPLTYVFDYEFSSMYSELTLNEANGYFTESYERDSSVFSDVCCSSCCCGGVIIPVVAVTLLATAAISAKRH